MTKNILLKTFMAFLLMSVTTFAQNEQDVDAIEKARQAKEAAEKAAAEANAATEAAIEAASSQPLAAILAICFGIIWGLIIFNIDRFIVASTGKGDGTEAITFGCTLIHKPII